MTELEKQATDKLDGLIPNALTEREATIMGFDIAAEFFPQDHVMAVTMGSYAALNYIVTQPRGKQ